MKNRVKKIFLLLVPLFLVGCGEAIKDAAAGINNPVERGLMYVATAIIFNGVFRALFNK